MKVKKSQQTQHKSLQWKNKASLTHKRKKLDRNRENRKRDPWARKWLFYNWKGRD